MINLVSLVMIILWATWAIYWYISSRDIKKTKVHGQSVIKQLMISLMLFFSVFFLISPMLSLGILGILLIPNTFYMSIVSIILCITGLTFAIYARVILGQNWNRNVVVQKEHELITKGPYAIVRHPIYTGIFLAFFGTVLSVGQLKSFIALAIFIIAFSIRIYDEEKLMAKQFQERYSSYKKHVKMIIPFIL